MLEKNVHLLHKDRLTGKNEKIPVKTEAETINMCAGT